MPISPPGSARSAGLRPATAAVARTTLTAVEQLAGGLGTALLAFVLFAWLLLVAAASLIGVGLLLVPGALRAVRGLADRERARLGRWGVEVPSPGPVPRTVRAALRSPVVGRELAWVAAHATGGLLWTLIGVVLPLYAVRDTTYPLWRPLLPDEVESEGLWWWGEDTVSGVLAVALLGLGWAALTVGAAPRMARLQARTARWFLTPPGTDLSLRVAQLTASRAAALDAHVSELRRIERSLHDGTQNRMVAVTVLLGAARRSLARDPAGTDELLERAQDAAELALAELRSVVRSIVPPVLADRGLAEALAGLAAACPVPCQVEVDVSVRCPASVEATAYFAVAEALTNVARHSGARAATVTVRQGDGRLVVRVADDGRGGADERAGSGLAGIRGRVEAHDGTLRVVSPAGGPTVVEAELPCGS
ncbi:sensor domain-containing protein [Blastococcus montanus]|uniref:sensor histidine kinase n=1 Tax=Blastococcus montanus TaxID=3144973 RepID=UPI00320881FA